jgi:hypothetical protein
MKKALLFIVLVLVVVGGIFYLATRTETPPENNQGASCDMSLWAHVYHGRFPSAEGRLHILDPCVTVSGVIMNARREKDGDWHVQLDLDPEFSSLLNQANLEKQQGYLVLEPICSNPVTQHDTLDESVCEDFSQSIFDTDLLGKRVAVTGAYVVDMEHGWTEIHPVTSIVPKQ